MVLEVLEEYQASDHLFSHWSQLKALHALPIPNPTWRMCSLEDYRAYCLYPVSDRVPLWLRDIVTNIKPGSFTPCFIHGDATVANSIATKSGLKFFDLSVRPTCGDPRQDWSKFFFSVVLGFNQTIETVDPFFTQWCSRGRSVPLVRDAGFAFHLAANIMRVLRKEPLSKELMERAHTSLVGFHDE